MYQSKGYGREFGNFEVKKFADKLKYWVCTLIGCTIDQLEDSTYKETPLGPEWTIWYWRYREHLAKHGQRFGKIYISKEEAEVKGLLTTQIESIAELVSEILTPRKLLQLLGTECGRNIIHPNIWVNALMKDYVPEKEYIGHGDYTEWEPSWIITDVRFPNEAAAIKSKGGIIIRINRNKRTSDRWQEFYPAIRVLDPDGWNRQNYQFSWFEEYITLEEYKDRVMGSTCMTELSKIKNFDASKNRIEVFNQIFQIDEHESETALDNYPHFDAILSNDGTVQELEPKVKEALINLKYLQL